MSKQIKKEEKKSSSFSTYEGSSWIGLAWIGDIFEVIFDIIGAIFKGLD